MIKWVRKAWYQQATYSCMVDCPVVCSKLEKLFSVLNGLHDRGGQFDDLL